MLKTHFFFILTAVLLGISINTNGQQYLTASPPVARLLGVNQGISQGMINCIYQDREGYMWICTKDGLNRYDGYQITTLRHKPNDPYSLSDNYCNAVLEDDNGNFWVATNTKGLLLYDKRSENFYPVSIINGNKENLCIRSLEYNKGKLFLKTLTDAILLDVSKVSIKNKHNASTDVKLLFSYNKAFPSDKYKVQNSRLFQYMFSHMPENDIWISYPDSIVHCIPSANFSVWSVTSYSLESFGFEKTANRSLFFFPMPGEPGNMIIASENKIIHFNNKENKIGFTKNLQQEDAVTTGNYFYTNDSNICKITRSGVIIYHPKTRELKEISEKDLSLPERSVFKLYTDRQNIRWYGSAGFGISKIDPRQQLFKSYKGAKPMDIYWKLPAGFLPALPLQLRRNWWVVSDKEGTCWAYSQNNDPAHPDTLYAYNTLTKKTTTHHTLPKNCVAYNTYGDETGGLWVYYQDASRKNYIAKVDKQNGSFKAAYSIPESIESPEPFVSQFYYDEHATLWLATINGLYSFYEKDKSWKHWKNVPGNDKSLSSDGVLSICADPISPEKYLWIGTEGAGLNRFEKSTGYCLHFTEKDGLPNDVAYCILSDSLNNLWISTNKGLSCFDPAKKTFRNFSDEDGLPGNEFNRYLAKRMQNGELMFGGVDGFVIFNPKEVLQKQAAVPLVFTGVAVLNKAINWKTDSSNLNAPIGYANTLTLQPGQNIFSVSFATLEYRSNEKKMYKYKLVGFDNDWTSPGSRNEVTYTNLAPGTYTLQVMGANTDGVWNENPISLKIVVKPYWYQTFLFKLFMVLLFAFAIYALYRYRLRQVIKMGNLRNRIARDLHDEIGSTLSSISIYAESAKKVTSENQKANLILSKINDGTSEMMEAMSDIVWAVNSGSDHFNDLANRLRSFAVEITEAKNIDILFTDDKDIPDIVLDMVQRKNIYLICKEAINNAVKYAGCSLLEVLISREHRNLIITIRDNGKGFELSGQQIALHGSSLGGNGIKNMKSRANEINASIEISSKIETGTTVMLSVPLKKS